MMTKHNFNIHFRETLRCSNFNETTTIIKRCKYIPKNNKTKGTWVKTTKSFHFFYALLRLLIHFMFPLLSLRLRKSTESTNIELGKLVLDQTVVVVQCVERRRRKLPEILSIFFKFIVIGIIFSVIMYLLFANCVINL